MGYGTASGTQRPRQAGVIVRDGESLPKIPESLLVLSPDEIQERINRIRKFQELNTTRLLPDLELQDRLENFQFVLVCAKTVVERQTRAVERE